MDLDEIRQEINLVDNQMKELFLKRMELAYQVAENKKRTQKAVYVPKREEEVLAACIKGVSEEYQLECKTFFGELMEISRAYQYSKLTEESEKRNMLLDGEGRALLEFTCTQGERHFRAILLAVLSSGLTAEEVFTEKKECGYCCRLRVSGDFSSKRAKAAVVQILEETEHVLIREI